MDLLARVETLRQIQAECNMYARSDGTGNVVLASSDRAWGHLHAAMLGILTEHYVVTDGDNSQVARLKAERVIDEVYDNGEDIAYNMRLLAAGELPVYLPDVSPRGYDDADFGSPIR